MQIGEVQVGDGVRICNENFIVTEVRGRTIQGNDDFLDPNEFDDISHPINSKTDHNYKRRVKELFFKGEEPSYY